MLYLGDVGGMGEIISNKTVFGVRHVQTCKGMEFMVSNTYMDNVKRGQ